MDFTRSAETDLWSERAREFAQTELAPRAEEWDRQGIFPVGIVPALVSQGFLGLAIPSEYGGGALSIETTATVIEELARCCPVVAGFVRGQMVGPPQVVLRMGTSQLKRRVLPRILRGEYCINMAMTEQDAGSDLGAIATTVRWTPEGVRVNGRKHMITNGFLSDEGFLVFARIVDPPPGIEGDRLVAVLVDGAAEGARLEDRWDDKLGQRGPSLADLVLDEVLVDKDAVLGADMPFAELLKVFNLERCGNALVSLGIAQAALDDVVAHCDERRQFGLPLIAFQEVQCQVADMALEIESARLLLYRALDDADHGRDVSRYWSSLAKMQANHAAQAASTAAVKLMGGAGYHAHRGPARGLRDALGYAIAGGTRNIISVGVADALSRHRLRPGSVRVDG